MNAWTAQASLAQLYNDYQSEIPLLIGAVLVLYIGLIFVSRSRKGGGQNAGASGKPIFDFDRMKRAGLLSDEEYKRVKRKMVEQAADLMTRGAEPAPPKRSAAEELALLDAAIETKGLQEALSPKELAEMEAAKARRAAILSGEAAGASQFDKYRDVPADGAAKILSGPGAEEEAASAEDAGETFGALDPLAQRPPASPEERLEEMLRAGVITQAEYENMKASYEKKKA